MDLATARTRIAAMVAVVAMVTFAAVLTGVGLGVPAAFAAGTIPDVTGLTASFDNATGVVDVGWDPYSSFGAGANPRIDATVTGGTPSGTDDTCTAGLAAGATGCHFTATADGTYRVTVTPLTDTDTANGVFVDVPVTLTAPTGSVSNLTASADPVTNVVTVSWDPGTVAWGSGASPVLNIGVSGLPSASTCHQSPPGTTGCQFTATSTTTYTITVTPSNSAGDGTPASFSLAVSLAPTPPNGAVSDLAAAYDPGTGLVTVGWTSGGVAWGTGLNRAFAVSVSGGTIAGTGNTCVGLTPAATGCAFVPDRTATYTITVTPVNDGGSGTPARTSIQVTVPGLAGTITAVAATTSTGETTGAAAAALAATSPPVVPAALLGLLLVLSGAGLVAVSAR